MLRISCVLKCLEVNGKDMIDGVGPAKALDHPLLFCLQCKIGEKGSRMTLVLRDVMIRWIRKFERPNNKVM